MVLLLAALCKPFMGNVAFVIPPQQPWLGQTPFQCINSNTGGLLCVKFYDEQALEFTERAVSHLAKVNQQPARVEVSSVFQLYRSLTETKRSCFRSFPSTKTCQEAQWPSF